MPFIQPEPFTFLNIKLTDQGRNSAAKGQLVFDRVIISDREIDYSIIRNGNYDIFNNKILDISDYYPDADDFNYDESDFFSSNVSNVSIESNGISPAVGVNEFGVTAEKITITGSASSITISNVVTLTKSLTYSNNSSNWGTNKITLGGAGTPVVGQIIGIPWVSPDYNLGTYNPTSMPQDEPCVLTFYKIISAVTNPNVYLVDRPIPDFGTGNNPVLTCQIFEDNLIENVIGNSATSDPGIWNMNIVRTNTVMGSELSVSVSGFSSYGSIEYNGAKHFFGFDEDTPIFGVIHYTNKWTGTTYAEKFLEGTFEMNLPGIMWHHNLNSYYQNQSSTIFSSYNSSGTTWGLYLSDFSGDTKYDQLLKTTYRDLKDGRGGRSFTVGRVYHKLQLILITDQELLTALTYKSNRNYTLPEFNLELSPLPKAGLYPFNSYSGTSFSAYTANGLIESGYDYFVTYIVENDPYAAGSSIGNAPSFPCTYIKKINQEEFASDEVPFLKLYFPHSDSFPYMRDDDGLSTINYGTGWNSNTVQILINKQLSSSEFKFGEVPYNQWFRVSNKTLGGNGVYRASDYGLNTINPRDLNNYEFIISYEDLISGSTYNLYSGFTSNQGYLNFGDECFFYGTIKTGIVSTAYKTRIKIMVDDTKLNSSNNSTYDPLLNKSTYITEINVLNIDGDVVAVGKPTYPILKNNIRTLNLLLDIDF